MSALPEVKRRGLILEFSPEDGELAARLLHELGRWRPHISIDRQPPVQLAACLCGQEPSLVVMSVRSDGLLGYLPPKPLADVEEIFVY